MFTGIIQEVGVVESTECIHENHKLLQVRVADHKRMHLGCSVAIDGVCLTLIKQEKGVLSFDVISETLACTTLSKMCRGSRVNIEKSLKMGDEVGGHFVSGHVLGVGQLKAVRNNLYTFQASPQLAQYLFEKAFVAIDGISLTICHMNEDQGTFSVGLIPETLRRTTLGSKSIGEYVNIEPDMDTKIQVDALRRVLKTREAKCIA